MEAVVPLIVLAFAYIITNKKDAAQSSNGRNKNMNKNKNKKAITNSSNTKEGFTNMGVIKKPNVNNLHNNNFMLTAPNDAENNYDLKASTEEYLDQNLYALADNSGKEIGANIQPFYSLTNELVDLDKFSHNNMNKLSGGKVKGFPTNIDSEEPLLDRMTGNSSQTNRKSEIAPIFNASDNMQYVHGVPNMSDFYQSRVVPSASMNNVKPFESIQVAPGLNLGTNSKGDGGFNSGMGARDVWQPKQVDDLRIKSNPKQTHSLDGLEGPRSSSITNRGLIGKFEKKGPDTFYEMGPERYFTTTGSSKGPRMRANDTYRVDTQRTSLSNNKYIGDNGVAKTGKTASYVKGVYTEPSKDEVRSGGVGTPSAVNKGSLDYDNKNGYSNRSTHRSITDDVAQTFYGGVKGAVDALMAPLMDTVRPTKRQELINSARIFGNIAPGSNTAPYVKSEDDIADPTIKEETMYSSNGYINNQGNGTGAYMVDETKASNTQRSLNKYGAIIGAASSKYGTRNHSAEYRDAPSGAKEKTLVGRTNMGNTSIFNTNIGVNTANKPEKKNYTDIEYPRANPPIAGSMPNIATYGETRLRNTQMDDINERINPDLLNEFKKNPYTLSVNNYFSQ